MTPQTRVAIVAGARSPFVKAGTVFADHRPLDLSLHAVHGLLDVHDVDPDVVEHCVWGIVIVDPRIPHMGREVVLRGRLPDSVGHPFAATGGWIVTQLAHEMARRDPRYGLISICGAGATAAMVLERD